MKYNYLEDARKVFSVLKKGGIAIVYMRNAYAIMSGTDEALKRVYKYKKRDLKRPSGIVAFSKTHETIHVLNENKKKIIKKFSNKYDLPVSIIAPYKKNHPLMKKLSNFAKKLATKNDTVNLLLNSGPLREEIAKLSLRNNFPLIASSANLSQKGTKYTVGSIESEIVKIADIIIDYGPCEFYQQGETVDQNGLSLSSTQIDFRDMRVVRKGVLFKKIYKIFLKEFKIKLKFN